MDLFHLKLHQPRGFEPSFDNFNTIIPLNLYSSIISYFIELKYQHQLNYNGKVINYKQRRKIEYFELFIFDEIRGHIYYIHEQRDLRVIQGIPRQSSFKASNRWQEHRQFDKSLMENESALIIKTI